MPAIEPVRGLTVPTVAGDVGVWGGELNTTINALAAILGSEVFLNSSGVGNNTTVTSSQAQLSRIVVLNTSSAPFQLNLPASNFALGSYSIGYLSSQSQPLTITAGSSGTGGTNAVFPTSSLSIQRLIYADGVNVFFSDPQPVFAGLGISISSSGLISVSQTAPTVQRFTTVGSTTYFPTSSLVQRTRTRMAGGGGGGGGGGTGSVGSSGGTTSFGLSSAPFTCLGGAGGSSTPAGGGAPSGGLAGTGGINGAGTLIARFPGGNGQGGWAISVSVTTNVAPGSPGGANPLGGAGAGQPNGLGGAGATNTGAGGAGGGSNQISDGGLVPGAGGGPGEYAEFWITAPSTGGLPLTIGGGGAGGAGTNGGGAGAAGVAIVEEFYI